MKIIAMTTVVKTITSTRIYHKVECQIPLGALCNLTLNFGLGYVFDV